MIISFRRGQTLNSFFVGLDVGGTHVRIAAYDESTCHISAVGKAAFKKLSGPEAEVEENVCKRIEAVIRERGRDGKELKGIGISSAAIFDRKSGSIAIWPNNKMWNGFPLKSYLLKRFMVPVVLEDDANSAALGEHLAGAGKGYGDFVYITISTGIGCGLILNNSLYIGSNGWAGEIGHIKVVDDGPECSCGARGCLQSIAAGPAIRRRFAEIKAFGNHETISLQEVADLAHKGVSEAKSVFGDAGVYIGKMVSNLVMLLDVPLVVLGGGVAEAGDVLFGPINSTLNACLNEFGRDVHVKKCQLGENNGVIGALDLIYRHVNEGNAIKFCKLSKNVGLS